MSKIIRHRDQTGVEFTVMKKQSCLMSVWQLLILLQGSNRFLKMEIDFGCKW
jgi:hypothetical protein